MDDGHNRRRIKERVRVRKKRNPRPTRSMWLVIFALIVMAFSTATLVPWGTAFTSRVLEDAGPALATMDPCAKATQAADEHLARTGELPHPLLPAGKSAERCLEQRRRTAP